MSTSARQVESNGRNCYSRCDATHGNGASSHDRIVPRHRWYPQMKGLGDALAAVLLLIPALPVIILAALCVKLSSRGPAFYSQTRVGLDGRPFRIYKLRTMVNNAEAKTGAVWCQANDPRVTRLGAWLRDLHIDEFPQLFNVLLGHMSLVGPRPERPEFVSSLEWQVPAYRQRLQVRPGVTGLAQLNLPPDSDIDGVRKKLMHDLYYIRHANPWLDLKIVFFTAWLLVKTCLRLIARIFVLPTQEEVNSRYSQIAEEQTETFVEQEA